MQTVTQCVRKLFPD
jgi:hypothetical protein